jgi:hypothetical protein
MRAQDGRCAREVMTKETFFPSPARGQGWRSLGERCQLTRMFHKSCAMRVRVARPRRGGGSHVPTADLSPVRTPPQDRSDTSPRSILRIRRWGC